MMTPEFQVKNAVQNHLTKMIKEQILSNIDKFAGRVVETKCDLTTRILGEDIVDMCVALDRASNLCNDICDLEIDTSLNSSENISIKGEGGKAFTFCKKDLQIINEYMESGEKIKAIKYFRESEISNSTPSLKEAKFTCDTWPFTLI